MEDTLISFETAKLAKEKEFTIPVYTYSCPQGLFTNSKKCDWNNLHSPYPHTSIPTQSLLQKWIREEHGIHIMIMPKMTPSNEVKYYGYYGKRKLDWNYVFDTYEEALEHELQIKLQVL